MQVVQAYLFALGPSPVWERTPRSASVDGYELIAVIRRSLDELT
jgi:hypothetical protein